jgi:hypothetical protein
LALADTVSRNPYEASDMAVPYTFTPANDANGYYVTLTPQPIAGTMAIFSVEDQSSGFNAYSVQTKAESNALNVLRGGNNSAAILFKDKLRFNKKPTGDVIVTMVPNVYQMEDDDVLIIPSDETGKGEMMLFQMCMQVLSAPGFQDDLNNDGIDAQNMGPKQ